MNKKTGKFVIGLLSLTMIVCAFSACKDNNNVDKDSGNKIVSGEENIIVVDNKTYNNGGLYVQYKGNTYFREYSNADKVGVSSEAKYGFNEDEKTTKYVNVILANGRIENVFEDDGYGNIYIVNDRFFLAGYNNKLYSVNMSGKDYVEFCKGEYLGVDEAKGLVYYKNQNTENAIYSVDSKTLKINKINNDEIDADFYNSLGINENKNNEEVLKTKVYSQYEEFAFKVKYGVTSGDGDYTLEITELEEVGNKIYYLMELSKVTTNSSNPEEKLYERIASEAYMYDKLTGKRAVLYVFKASDKDEVSDEDLYTSGDIIEEPLAENEMYLEIRLSDKGLKENFEVRVEEVGGLIIGKRIEYEGTHSRSEGTLKIKVTKEVGAMLTVYIDNKVDSQMLIEE